MEAIIIITIGASIFLFALHSAAKKDDKIKEEKEQMQRKMEEDKKIYFEENNIPESVNTLCCTNITVKGMPLEGKWNVFLWKENNILNFCGSSDLDGIKKIKVPVENVKYFNRAGDSRVETITEGGGVSIERAIVGGVVGAIIGAILMGIMGMIVAFGIGALLAGRNKTITKNKEIDNRKTYLYYSEDNEDSKMVFTSKTYEVLLELIPDKEMSYIENNKVIEENNSKNDSIYNDIEKLSELKDKGILTEDEFNQKKQLLLNKIQ